MAQTIATDRKAYIITGPTSGIGRCTAFELAKHGTVVLVGRDRGKLAEVQKIIEQKGPARGIGRVRLVRSCERAARGLGDHRAPSPDRRLAQQCGHRADARNEKRAGLGHDIRDEPSRPVRADRGARAASPRRSERRLRLLRRRRSRAQTRYGRWLPWRSLYLCWRRAHAASGSPAALRCRGGTPTPRQSSAISPR